jgi:hypothetical protein
LVAAKRRSERLPEQRAQMRDAMAARLQLQPADHIRGILFEG